MAPSELNSTRNSYVEIALAFLLQNAANNNVDSKDQYQFWKPGQDCCTVHLRFHKALFSKQRLPIHQLTW